MSKVRVYDLAKQFGMKGPKMAQLLRDLGFEKIKSHMAVLDGPDQMQVVARLEAQGLERKAAPEASTPSARKLPGVPRKKKSLPPPITGTQGRKALPEVVATSKGPATAEQEALEVAPEPIAPPPRVKRTQAAPAAKARPVDAEQETAEPAPATEAPQTASPAAEAPAAESPASVSPAAESPAAESPATESPATESPAAESPATESPLAESPTETETETEPAETSPEPERPQKPVKRLIVPKAKARVVGRIELPQETIRDATRRSAPPSERDSAAADRKLRRAALQSTQSRTASRTPSGHRRAGMGGRMGGRMGRRDGPRGRKRSTSTSITPTVDLHKVIEIEPPISVKGVSEALGIKVSNLVATLTFKLGVKGKTINSFLSPDEVELVALEVGRKIKLVEHKEAEEELIEELVEKASEESAYQRAPVLTFMGHVDHGKTTLLDALRESDVVKGEAGGITQHIGAYKITTAKNKTFVVLDTPGHAAFTSMRARGASITDIVVLVVAADDGVMPQTEEAINHSKAAKVPIVVAINKCDTPGANPMQVRQQLAVKGLQPEEWGGKTQTADVSAVTKEGIDALIEKIFLEAELLELTAKPSAPGLGIVVESKQSPEQGVVVNVLVTDGTLRLKDRILCGNSLSRVRGIMDDHGNRLETAGPSTPVTLLGLDKLPQPGDKVFVITDTRKAKQVVEERQRRSRDISLAERSSVTLENLSAALKATKTEEVKIILKADVMGSLEPIRQSLDQLSTDEVRVHIIHAALGGITETDVSLAEASKALIIGFNSMPDPAARQAADRAGVEIRFYDVIYNLVDDVKLALEGLLAPEEIEAILGHAEIRAIFKSSKFGNIAGCYVNDGIVKRNALVRLVRDGHKLWSGKLNSLRRVDDDVREVKTKFECGMTLDGYNNIKIGDELEFFEVEYVKRTL